MKRFLLVSLVILGVTYARPGAEELSEADGEQLTGACGEIKNRNSSYQFGTGLWLEYIVETARPVTSDCPWLTVSVEAWVNSVQGSALSAYDMFTATARRQVPVPGEGRYQTTGLHYRSYLWIFTYSNGATSSTAEVRIQQEEDSSWGPPPEDGGGYGSYCGEDPEAPCDATGANGWRTASPIIVDVDRNGYHLTSVDDGVMFDLDADGALELVAWTDAMAEDAFLAMDRNGNGRIDDGSELFGNNTPVYPGALRVTAANGFEALKFLESPVYGRAERNEIVNARDCVFPQLLLWTDRNHNGLSEPDELQSLSDAGLLEIRTDYKTARRRDVFGNEFRQRAKATWQKGEAFVYDVWLRRSQ